MAEGGEPIEITAVRTNLNFITPFVTVGGSLQWFSNSLVEKSFLTSTAARGILHRDGTEASKAGELLDSVLNTLRATEEKRRRFNEFIAIFSNDQVYEELVRKLRRGLIRVDCNFPSSSTLTSRDSGFMQSLTPSRLTSVHDLCHTTSSPVVVWSLDMVKEAKQALVIEFTTIYGYTARELRRKEAKDKCFVETFCFNLLLSSVRKSILHVRFFSVHEKEILKAENCKEILGILTRHMDYTNYEILHSIIKSWCSPALNKQMEDYCKSLKKFETSTTVDVYLKAIADEVDEAVRKGFSEMVVKIDKPATQCTLHEVRQLNKEIIKESSLCSYSVYIGAVYRGSVVVRFIFPSSAVGWVLAAITPEFMAIHHLIEVTVDGIRLSTIKANIIELVYMLKIFSKVY